MVTRYGVTGNGRATLARGPLHGQGIDSPTWRRHVWRNRFQSLLLLGLLGGFLGILGWLLWGVDGLLVLMVLGILGLLLNPALPPQVIMRMHGAVPLGRMAGLDLHHWVAWLSEKAGLPRAPRLFYLPGGAMNAFTLGSPRHAAIAIGGGLLQRLGEREIVAVLAHEISHIRNNDLRVMGLADFFSRATGMLCWIGQLLLLINLPLILFSDMTINWWAILLLLLAPAFSSLAQLALSRTREYDADLNAVLLTADPEGLASALVKIERAQQNWLERIFLPGQRSDEPSLLRTHPHTRQRIARLRELHPARR